jgi:hypothetical protein
MQALKSGKGEFHLFHCFSHQGGWNQENGSDLLLSSLQGKCFNFNRKPKICLPDFF